MPGVELPGGVEGERRVLRHLLQVHPSGEQLVLQDGQLDGGSRVAVVLQTACNILHPEPLDDIFGNFSHNQL